MSLLVKLLAMGIVGLFAARVLFRPRMQELGQRFNRAVDITLVVIAVVYAIQLIVLVCT